MRFFWGEGECNLVRPVFLGQELFLEEQNFACTEDHFWQVVLDGRDMLKFRAHVVANFSTGLCNFTLTIVPTFSSVNVYFFNYVKSVFCFLWVKHQGKPELPLDHNT